MNNLSSILSEMLKKDTFSNWLGLVIDDYQLGCCKLHYTIREEMLNGFGTTHGGVIFSAADSAFAFACNSQGFIAVALDVTINYLRPTKAGDLIYVEARELHFGNKTGFFDVITKNEAGEMVALFRGTAYKTQTKIC